MYMLKTKKCQLDYQNLPVDVEASGKRKLPGLSDQTISFNTDFSTNVVQWPLSIRNIWINAPALFHPAYSDLCEQCSQSLIPLPTQCRLSALTAPISPRQAHYSSFYLRNRAFSFHLTPECRTIFFHCEKFQLFQCFCYVSSPTCTSYCPLQNKPIGNRHP